jgi:hypothetical protein
MKYKHRELMVASLREFADLIERKGLELPIDSPNLYITFSVDTKERIRKAAKALRNTKKLAYSNVFELCKEIGCIKLYFSIHRELVCKKVVVGMEEVPEHVIPATVREKVEWICDDPILR